MVSTQDGRYGLCVMRLAASLLAMVCAGPPVLAESELQKRWRTEAPRAWAELEEFMTKISCTIKVVQKGTYKVGPEEPNGSGGLLHFRILRNGNWLIVESRTERYEAGSRTSFLEGVLGMNSRYGFHLARQKPEDKFALSHLTGARPIVEAEYHGLAEYFYRHMRGGPQRMEEWLVNPRIRVLDLATDRRDGRELAKLRWRYVHDPRDSIGTDTEGLTWFDPARRWVIVESEATAATQSNRSRIDFAEIDGFPFPSRLENRGRSPDMPAGQWGISETFYTNVKRDNAPEYEFAVSAYGLPEIDPAIARPRRIWLWCLVLAVAAFGGMVFFRWYARRKAA